MYQIFKITTGGEIDPRPTGWHFGNKQTAMTTAARLAWQGVPFATCFTDESRGLETGTVVGVTFHRHDHLLGTTFHVER